MEAKEIETGGPAFPLGNTPEEWMNGMTLRDYFAAKAMQGLLTGGGDFEKFSHLAADAYAIADAMLEARAK